MNLNVSTGVGFAALFGVSIMNGVLLVKAITTLREQGEAIEDAIVKGSQNCLRPILMASLVAVLGFVDTPQQIVALTGTGRRFVAADADERRDLWRDQLLRLRFFKDVHELVSASPRRHIGRESALRRSWTGCRTRITSALSTRSCGGRATGASSTTTRRTSTWVWKERTPEGRAFGEVSINRIVARFRNGRVLQGFTSDFLPGEASFHVTSASAGGAGAAPEEIAVPELKALFFARTFEGDPQHKKSNDAAQAGAAGRRIRVVFADGEVLVGTTQGYFRSRPGFVVPVDKTGNNERCFVVAAATREVSFDVSARIDATGPGSQGAALSTSATLVSSRSKALRKIPSGVLTAYLRAALHCGQPPLGGREKQCFARSSASPWLPPPGLRPRAHRRPCRSSRRCSRSGSTWSR